MFEAENVLNISTKRRGVVKLHNMKEIKKERTLVLIKPDGVQRSLIGEVT